VIRSGTTLILDATLSDADESCHLDALELVAGKAVGLSRVYVPVLFTPHERVTREDRLRLAFGAAILARIQGAQHDSGRIIHGRQFKVSRVGLATISGPVRDTVDQIRALGESSAPPPLLLNRHCAECEFRRSCRASAVEKDDLSLLRGLTPKDIAGLNRRGIFTVTQYSYTFRPGRMKRAGGRKHDHSLQALAVREQTAYIALRPELPGGVTRLYLDVEGLPDDDFYYLIGLTVEEGDCRRHFSFWADNPAEEASIWRSFLEVMGRVGGFCLFHYGSYEKDFVEKMGARHGGDPDLLARVKASSVNVLSLIYARIYFPVHSNDLKSVADCLGFQWSDPDASGLQAIVWRREWEDSRKEAFKRRLLIYNQEDCSALAAVVALLSSLGDEPGRQADGGLRFAGVRDAGAPYRHRFGATQFALPELARITKCAYFDYQRNKVLCRTSPVVKKAALGRKRLRKKVLKVNREVDWGRPASCPHCGSTGFDPQSKRWKLVIDLKPSRGGLKRQVTRHKAWRYRCRKCLGTFLPEGYLAMSSGYGRGLFGWVVYSSVSLRQTNEAIGEALEEWFGVRLGRCYASKIRQRAVDRYRVTYNSLLAALRSGPVVHADETKVAIRGAAGSGYVWAFASPDTAVYVYAPTRGGETARETLSGFQGVLVSDFFAAYDSLDCPQQKCLIHLIRDVNDDLLKNPFDDELRRQAARLTVVLQGMVETIDRYGLKKYHLHRHKKDVERFFAAESEASYGSEVARYYQNRLLKYRAKLFTFLDYDGVPWNNNNAENAIKRFVSRRKSMGTTFTESGIGDYLLLLSIFQTLRYRNASFWRFLLSGETDIATFTASRR
jgi:predicted RecB family nuclease